MSSLSTIPKGDSAWLLRKAVQRIMQQVSVLETNIGSSTTGNSANTQVIFNDAGTLRGDAGLTYNASTDTLTAGAATITGALTVDTTTLVVNPSGYADRVGIGTATPAAELHVVGGANFSDGTTTLRAVSSGNVAFLGTITTDPLVLRVNNIEQYRIAQLGVFTWSDGAGSTRMTLNSTGLGVGVSPSFNIHTRGATDGRIQVEGANGFGMVFIQASSGNSAQLQLNSNGGSGRRFALNSNSSGQFTISDETAVVTRLTIDSSGNVGIGVTPSAWGGSYKALQLQSVARSIAATGAGTGDLTVAFNAIYDSTDSRWEYAGTGDKAGRYSQTGSGNHRWFVSNTAGTAGNEITDFASAAMTLDASGNLLLGTVTSPTGTKIGSIAKLGSVCVEGSNAISVSTTPVALARIIGTGGLFFVSGFNTSGGAQGWWLVASIGGTAPTVIASGNNTGLTVAFTNVSGVINMNTVSGTLSVTSFAITNSL